MVAAARFVLGLGMGGEWNTCATLVAASWPSEFRAKAISLVQSSWALGFAAAALVAGGLGTDFWWGGVVFFGNLCAFFSRRFWWWLAWASSPEGHRMAA